MVTQTQTQTGTMVSRPLEHHAQLKLDLSELSFSKASQASLDRWKLDLNNLLKHASHRFADISWAPQSGAHSEICAHKAIIYARASGQFQLKYLSGPAPSPHSRLPGLPSTSSVYLNPSARSTTPQSAISHPRPASPSVASLNSISGSARQVALLNGTDPTLFQSILEALYTANGLSEVFAFLFDDHAAGDSPEARTDKLRKDLLYMWRSKLYADCQIVLINQQHVDNPTENLTYEQEAVFSAHRSILCSRSPYFASLLLDPYADSNNRLFTLASPPFTPASLHFSLGYLYCGTLDFSNRTFDLSTAMQIWRSAQYLGLDLLREEVEAKISDMCHNFKDTCKSCISRIGRVYAFSLSPDVASKRLQKAAEPLVIQHFGLIWNQAIGELHYEAQTHVVDLLCLTIDPNTVIDAVRGSKRLKERLANERSEWADHLLSMLEPVDQQIGVVLQQKFPAVVTSKGFLELFVGVGFSNDIVEKALMLVVDHLTDENAPETYQVLVGQVLLREEGLPMDARVFVEDAKSGVLKYIKSHWTTIRSLNGFDPLENWALKEISDEIEIPIDDLLLSTPLPRPCTKTGLQVAPTTTKLKASEDAKSTSPASLRASVLSRSASRAPPSMQTEKSPDATLKPRPPRLTMLNGNRNRHTSENSSLNSPVSATPRMRNQSNLIKSPSSAMPNPLRPAENRVSSSSGAEPKGPSPKTLNSSTASPKSLASPKSDETHSSKTSHDHKTPKAGTRSGVPSLTSNSHPTPTPRRTRPSRPASPAPSATSVTRRTTSQAGLGRKSDVSTTKPPKTRPFGSVSSTSTASKALSISSAHRKSVANTKPPVVRKMPSTISMRYDTSTAPVGSMPSRSSHTPHKPIPSVSTQKPTPASNRKTLLSPANITFSPKSDRLRTTSATTRPHAAVSIPTTSPVSGGRRPSSVTFLRTSTSTKIPRYPQTITSPNTTGTTGATKVPKSKASVVPPLPSTSPSNSTGRPSSDLASSDSSTPSPSGINPSGEMADDTPSSDPTEILAEVPILADLTVSSEVSDTPSQRSQSSTVSNSTIRLPSASKSLTPTHDGPLPSNTIVVTPSSSPMISQLAGGPSSTLVPSTAGQSASKPPGTVLLIGIPCVVATNITLDDGLVQPVKFRAVVKYLGETFFGPGQWVGVEVAEKEEMIKKEWNDGTVDGIRYFELGQESKESRSRLFRNLSATPSGGDRSHSSHSSYLGSNVEDVGSVNSLRPSFVSKASSHRTQLSHSNEEERPTRGLFVRPQEVIFVF